MGISIGSSWDPQQPLVMRFYVVDEDFAGIDQYHLDLLAGSVAEYRSGNQWVAMPTALETEPRLAIAVTFPAALCGTNTSIRLNTSRASYGPIIWTFPPAVP